MQVEEIIMERLKQLLLDTFPKTLEIGNEEYFADTDVMSSFDFILLITKIEETFNINLSDDEITEENLGSFSNLMCYLTKKLTDK